MTKGGSVSEGFKGQLGIGKGVISFTHDPWRLPFPQKLGGGEMVNAPETPGELPILDARSLVAGSNPALPT